MSTLQLHHKTYRVTNSWAYPNSRPTTDDTLTLKQPMNQLQQMLKTMRSAYEIFLTELETHLAFFEDTAAGLAATSDGKEVLLQRAKKLEHAFHLLKGASGFLKLQNIRELSIRGEKWFKDGTIRYSDFGELSREFCELVEEMTGELKTLKELLKESVED